MVDKKASGAGDLFEEQLEGGEESNESGSFIGASDVQVDEINNSGDSDTRTNGKDGKSMRNMLNENLIYQETMTLLLEEKNF